MTYFTTPKYDTKGCRLVCGTLKKMWLSVKISAKYADLKVQGNYSVAVCTR